MKGDKKQVFFNTYKQVTKSGVVNSKRKEETKPWRGVELGTVTGLPDGYSIAKCWKTTHKKEIDLVVMSTLKKKETN